MRGDEERLADILAAVRDIEDFVSDITESAFLEIETGDRRTFRAIGACLIVLGEAVKALSDEVKERHPGVDWRGYAGLRDIVTHRYFEIQLDLVWTTIQEELPILGDTVQRELDRLEGRNPG